MAHSEIILWLEIWFINQTFDHEVAEGEIQEIRELLDEGTTKEKTRKLTGLELEEGL